MVTSNNDLNFLILRDRVLWELDNFKKINIVEFKEWYKLIYDEDFIESSFTRLVDSEFLKKKGDWYTKKESERSIFD